MFSISCQCVFIWRQQPFVISPVTYTQLKERRDAISAHTDIDILCSTLSCHWVRLNLTHWAFKDQTLNFRLDVGSSNYFQATWQRSANVALINFTLFIRISRCGLIDLKESLLEMRGNGIAAAASAADNLKSNHRSHQRVC